MKTLKKLAAVATAGMLIPAACLNTALASPTQSSQPAAASVAIHTRSTVAFQGMRHCGHFANADGSMVISLVDALGAGDLGTRGYTVAAHGCNRVQCWDTSGVYLCNVNSPSPGGECQWRRNSLPHHSSEFFTPAPSLIIRMPLLIPFPKHF